MWKLKRFNHYHQIIVKQWLTAAIFLLFAAIFRVVMLWQYGSSELIVSHSDDLLNAFWMGMRFDLKTAAIFLALFQLVAFFTLLVPFLNINALLNRLFTPFATLFFLFLTALSIGNHFYFGFYQSPINALVFGLVEDDTRSVLKTIWSDYPVVWGLGCLLILTALQVYFLKGLTNSLKRFNQWHPSFPVMLIYIPLSLFLTALAGRGTVGTFPLRDLDMAVSTNTFINQLIPNGAQSLFLAWTEREMNQISNDVNVGLTSRGFDSALAAGQVLGIKANSEGELYQSLYQRTPIQPAIEKNPPHVVFALMESMGRHLLHYHGEGNDLMGRLAPHAQSDLLLMNFTSSQHGTHPSLEALLLNSPVTPLTQSRYGYQSYRSAAAKPYKDAGYKTVFLTAGPATWRSLDTALPRQYFDRVLSKTDILRRFPEAGTSTWGVDDDYMFRYASELLAEAEAKGEKLFLFMLSITNHPPYQVGSGYQPKPINLLKFGARVIDDRIMAENILKTYQYANDSLGGFIDRVKANPALAQKTLIAASGDHNTRTFFNYEGDNELHLKYGVPFYFYLPKAYQGNAILDANRFGSHWDIFPTLYQHSLSSAEYLALGQDLITPPKNGLQASSIANISYVLTAAGAATNSPQPQYYHWDRQAEHLSASPVPPAEESTDLVQAVNQARARMALFDWQIRVQALKHPAAQ
ncbi:Phosphoglycerol transferase MdoB [Oceanospirillum multiglobuliferum]|uniref:Sulfatase N-terminal domain-containing protein n=1 Tax=Oceanospirillum multiglobuliferum TaxID=64969 RepID=A0A1T4RCN1_9GAMM|nr:alkaline phosphatase family protein [Oceanospirillum multiglobuliferum]OPX55181.1 hypothetical protein BTE48_10515 [Oceanospirillum multiglobuliferum]SKA13576.1 Phosphoglycerol transferase MdoB [Oceanospirillum multiglobuliferum]